jgi:hypothetical protein
MSQLVYIVSEDANTNKESEDLQLGLLVYLFYLV